MTFKKYFTWSAWISIINAFLLQLASFSFTRKSCISSGASGIRCSKFLEIKKYPCLIKTYFVILVTLWTLSKLTFIKLYNTINCFAFQNIKSIRKLWVGITSFPLRLLSYQIFLVQCRKSWFIQYAIYQLSLIIVFHIL